MKPPRNDCGIDTAFGSRKLHLVTIERENRCSEVITGVKLGKDRRLQQTKDAVGVKLCSETIEGVEQHSQEWNSHRRSETAQ